MNQAPETERYQRSASDLTSPYPDKGKPEMQPIQKSTTLKLGPRVEQEIRARILELETRIDYARHQGKRPSQRDRAELGRLHDFLAIPQPAACRLSGDRNALRIITSPCPDSRQGFFANRRSK